MIYYAVLPLNGQGGCDMCALGTYKFIDDQACHANCPSKYYEN